MSSLWFRCSLQASDLGNATAGPPPPADQPEPDYAWVATLCIVAAGIALLMTSFTAMRTMVRDSPHASHTRVVMISRI